MPESTCLGAAFAAGLSTKIYKNIEEIKSCIRPESEVLPNLSSTAGSNETYEKWLASVNKTLG